jgi:hypothetical protein
MTATLNSLAITLFAILFMLFIPVVQGGDEPAPVVYIDPETGELYVQNPPKLSREHDVPVAVEVDSDNTNEQPTSYNKTIITGGIIVSFSIILVGWALLRRTSLIH